MSNLTGMSLLKCMEWKVFLLQALKGDRVGGLQLGPKRRWLQSGGRKKKQVKGKRKEASLCFKGSVKFQSAQVAVVAQRLLWSVQPQKCFFEKRAK